MRNKRKHTGFAAFWIHRVSGLVLAVFLPLHFLTLGTALKGADGLQRFIAVTDTPVVKFFELGLVAAFAVHFAGGLRLLLLELVGWDEHHAGWLAASLGFAAFAGVAFLISALAQG